MLTVQHYLGISITLALTALVGIYSLRYVKGAADFSVGGRKLTSWMVTGSLVGSFIGGTSTVGTAQVAYQYGISGIWFTLGAGVGCLLLALLLAKPLREANVETIPQFLGEYYGDRVVTWASLYSTVGIFIQIIAQVLAGIPLLMSILPVSVMQAALIALGFIMIYVIFGGFWGTSLVGALKTILLYVALGGAGLYCLQFSGGFSGLVQGLPTTPYFNLFPTGISKESAQFFSVVVGLISTQTYMQVVFAGRDVRASRNGMVLAGLLIPLLGAVSVAIGMFMRVQHPTINPGLALPLFVTQYLPPLLGGVLLAALLISFIMTGASLTLGICTMLSQDIYRKLLRPSASGKELIGVTRLLILLISGSALLVVQSQVDSLILQWAFLSMALRGVTVFLPLLMAVFYRGPLAPATGLWAIALSPLVAILWAFGLPGAMQPLFVGLVVCGGILLLGVRT